MVLIGPPGAGKSAVGPLLADRLGVPFADTDADVGAAAGKPVGDIFVEDGEDAFRELERAAVTRALGERAPCAPAAGCWPSAAARSLDPGIRELLAGLPVVYLSAEFGTVAQRIGLDRPRVVVPGNPRGRLRAMLDERDAGLRPAGRRSPCPPTTWTRTSSRTRSRPRSRSGMTATRIDVTPSDGSPPYEVVVGVGVLGELPGLVPRAAPAPWWSSTPRGSARSPARPAARSPRRATRCTPSRSPTARRPRPSRSRPACGPGWRGTT